MYRNDNLIAIHERLWAGTTQIRYSQIPNPHNKCLLPEKKTENTKNSIKQEKMFSEHYWTSDGWID